MTTIKAFIKRHPVLTYFVVTFAISWGGFVLVGGTRFFSGTNWQTDPLFLFAVWVMVAGPSVAGILLTGLVSGKAGFRELLSRVLTWWVGARWYAAALLTAPVLQAAILFSLSRISPSFLLPIVTTGDKASLLLSGIIGGGDGWLRGGDRLDWVRHPSVEAAVRCLGHRAHRGRPMGRVAPASHVVGRKDFLRSDSSGPLPAPVLLLCYSSTDGVPGADGVGLRSYWEPTRGDTHARELHIQHALRARASDDRGALLDL